MNKAKPEVKITLDKERTLTMDLNAMVRFEQQTGKNLLSGDTFKSISATDLRVLLWACLKGEDMELMQEQVGAMIHPGNMEYVSEVLSQMWNISMPEKDEGSDPLANLQNG
jgi:hypothetical protein